MKKKDLSTNRYFTYVLLDPRKPGQYEYGFGDIALRFEFEPYYVGKGSGNRILVHYNNSKGADNPYKCNIINKLTTLGYAPCFAKLADKVSEEVAFSCEVEAIATIGLQKFKQGPLVNVSTGGGGGSGNECSEEHKARLREFHTGKEVKESTKDKLRQYAGEKHHQYGTSPSEEWKSIVKVANTKFRFTVMCPDGKCKVIYNLMQFCKDNSICDSHLYQTATGKRNHCKNHYIVEKEPLPANWVDSSYYQEYLSLGGVDVRDLYVKGREVFCATKN